jgi:hypothetical protein
MAGAMEGLQKMGREQPREPDRSELLVRVCEQIEQRTDSINPAEFSLSNALQLPEIAQIDPQFRRRVAEDLVGLVIVIASEALERKIRNEKPSEAEDIVTDVIANPDIDDDEAYAIHSAAREIERALRAVLMQPPSDTTPPSA